MGSYLAKIGYKIRFTMPFDGEAEVWKISQAIIGKNVVRQVLILQPFYFLMVNQEQFYHTCVSEVNGILVFRIIRVKIEDTLYLLSP